jgi:hypothetical protein
VCDNAVFQSTGVKSKREGFSYFDSASNIPAITHRSSSGTTRTVVFAATLSDSDVKKLVVGEGIVATTTATSGNEFTYYTAASGTVVTISTTTISNDTITYTAVGSLTEGSTATSTLTVKRAYPHVKIHDYWRFTGSTKAQQIMALSSQPLSFYYDSTGNRKQAAPISEAFTVTLATPAVFTVTSTANYFVGLPVRFSTTGALPTGLSASTTYYVSEVTSGTTFKVSASYGGANVDTSGSQSGVHTLSTITTSTGTATKQNTVTFNERAIIFRDRIGNVPQCWNGTVLHDLQGAPDASAGCVYLGRIWTNDKTYPDRLHYSATGSHVYWQGVSDSGAIDINPGDGDVKGITAPFPFKGSLYVAKGGKFYRVLGNAPENFRIETVSEGLGIESANSIVAVDQNEVMFVSSKGMHSLGTTANYGDVEASFLSAKIQPNFNSWSANRLEFMQAVYIEELSSLVYNVAETSTTAQDNLWLYDVGIQQWCRWPGIDAQAIGKVYRSNINTLFMGTSDGKLIRAQNGVFLDYGSTAIRYRLRTGLMYVDGQAITKKAFKRLFLFFKPRTTYSFTARVKIDQYAEQAIGFSGTAAGDVLGTDFVLGSSVLGTNVPFSAYSGTIDGIGHGIIVEVEQSGTSEQVDILGFAIEYEVAETGAKEVTSS